MAVILTDEQRSALANETRIKALQLKIARHESAAAVTASLAKIISTQNNDYTQRILSAQQELNGLLLGSGPGITAEYGSRSVVDNAASEERSAGQAAVIGALKENPELTLEDILPIWTTAALSTRPADRQWLLNSPQGLLNEYMSNLLEAGQIPEATFEAFRQWIVDTPVEQMP